MAVHAHILHNRSIRPAAEAGLYAGQLGLLAGWGVFTTLRVSDSVPFAWERHWARMSRDAKALNVAMPTSAAELEGDLLRLIQANGRPACTLRLAIVRNGGGLWEGPHGDTREADTIALTADSKQWGAGVRLDVTPDARFAACEFAGAKVLSWCQNLTWAERAQRKGFDETVLLNERGTVAECTSANIFAISGHEVVTPPLADGCLPGITREVLLNEIRIDGIRIGERSLTLEDLYRCDGAFITSTTRDLLPIFEIAGKRLGRDSEVTERLSAAFRSFAALDIAGRKPVATMS
ncbi:MAG: aminotransferase class IV family protein [Acidobacteriota bacterium]|nr:aminotransferase class IV family protein [Acidobacteriota bacterium]